MSMSSIMTLIPDETTFQGKVSLFEIATKLHKSVTSKFIKF